VAGGGKSLPGLGTYVRFGVRSYRIQVPVGDDPPSRSTVAGKAARARDIDLVSVRSLSDASQPW
jgi:hypothetical protein